MQLMKFIKSEAMSSFLATRLSVDTGNCKGTNVIVKATRIELGGALQSWLLSNSLTFTIGLRHWISQLLPGLDFKANAIIAVYESPYKEADP